ncbi:MAG: flagellar motor protein MotB [Acidobacteriaceae bacterium]
MVPELELLGKVGAVAETPEIIIVKKRGSHGGRHGGAWKVAYADFVTGMMALFIVLWLMNASKQVQTAVGGYFRDPHGVNKLTGASPYPIPPNVILKKQDMQKLKEQILQAIRSIDPKNKLKNQIEITITPEGLRIELMESAKGTFFKLGSPAPTPALQELLKVLSQELSKLPNKISIEGHTDAKPYSGSQAYDNWDLSCDRANAARRIMQADGLREDQVSQVRGFADQRLRLPQHPFDPSNRRISLIVQYLVVKDGEVPLPPNLTLSNTVPSPN